MSTSESRSVTANQILTRDGRSLAYADFGDPVGKPVFYFHGANGSRLERHPDESIAVSLGARIITIDRPGHGLSDFQPNRKLLDWPDDVEALADALEIGTFAVVGFSAGAPFVAACAYKIPHRLTSAGIISGFASYDRPGATEDVNLFGRTFLGLLRRAPWLLKLPIGVMVRMADSNPAGSIDQMTSRMTESDRVLISQPDIKAMFIESIAESLCAGSRGTLAEGALLVRPWGFQLRDINTKVHLWQGQADTIIPLQMGRYLARAIPNCRATFVPGEGHMLVFSRWNEILSVLVS